MGMGAIRASVASGGRAPPRRRRPAVQRQLRGAPPRPPRPPPPPSRDSRTRRIACRSSQTPPPREGGSRGGARARAERTATASVTGHFAASSPLFNPSFAPARPPATFIEHLALYAYIATSLLKPVDLDRSPVARHTPRGAPRSPPRAPRAAATPRGRMGQRSRCHTLSRRVARPRSSANGSRAIQGSHAGGGLLLAAPILPYRGIGRPADGSRAVRTSRKTPSRQRNTACRPSPGALS